MYTIFVEPLKPSSLKLRLAVKVRVAVCSYGAWFVSAVPLFHDAPMLSSLCKLDGAQHGGAHIM